MFKACGVAALLCGVLLLCGRASAQDADEVAKLKREIELLKKENDLLTRENALLKKENEQLKAGGAKGQPAAKPGSPLLARDTTWEGVYVREELLPGGKKGRLNADARLEVKKRDGDKYEGELWIDNGKLGMQVEGTVSRDGAVTMAFKKDLVGDGKLRKDIIGTGRGKGSVKDKQFDMTITIPNVNFKADLKVKCSVESLAGGGQEHDVMGQHAEVALVLAG